MKKILCLCSLALLVTLTGCKDAVTGVTNGNEALITVGKTEITKNDVYTGLKSENGVTAILSKLTAYISDKEVPLTDEIKKEAKEYVNSLKKSVSEDSWKAFLTSMGYENENQYIEERAVVSIQAQKLTSTYLKDNYDEVKEKYQVRKVQIFQTSDSKVAAEVQEKVKNGELTIEKAVTEYKDSAVTTTFKGTDQIITNAISLDSDIIANIMEVTEDNTLLKTYQFSSDLSKYYVIKVVDVDVEFADALETLESLSTISDEAFAFYLKKYGFKIYDIDLYNGIESQAPTYIVQE